MPPTRPNRVIFRPRGCAVQCGLLLSAPFVLGTAELRGHMKTTPVQTVRESFGDKQKLVAAVKKLATKDLFVDRVNAVKGLERVSNAKLLKLHATLTRAKKDFGSRDKLIDAILGLEKRTKDEGYKARVERYPLARLLDAHQSAERRAARAKAAPKKTAKKKKKVRTKKARAKAASK